MSSPIVFVAGATGRQGGALVNHLSKQGIEMRTLTRNASSGAAQRIKSLGVSLTEGDLNDDDMLQVALAGCTTLFLNLSPDFKDLSKEVALAKKVMSAARNAGVKQIIYTGSLGTENPERIPGYESAGVVKTVIQSKKAVEHEVRTAGFETWTILRPGNFMTNFLAPLVFMYQGLADQGVWTTPLKTTTLLPMIDPNDIGKFAAAAVLEPTRFSSQQIELASEMMSVNEILRDLSHATGRRRKAVFLTDEEIAERSKENPALVGQAFLHNLSAFIDYEKLKQWGIGLGTFAEFLERENESVKESYE